MKTILSILAATLLLNACTKSTANLVDPDSALIQAVAFTYNGDFVRLGGDSATVILKLETDGTFYGESLEPGFPVICSGTYSVTSSTIHFENECSASGNQPILNGSFNYTKPAQDRLLIWRTIDGVTDEYRLRWPR